MNRNPLIPFALIAVLGLGLMFLFSFIGLDQAEKIANGEYGETADMSAEEIYASKTCIGCHGNDLAGGAGAPGLVDVGERLDQEEIKDIIINGKGLMPGGQANAQEAEVLAEWLANYGEEGGADEDGGGH